MPLSITQIENNVQDTQSLSPSTHAQVLHEATAKRIMSLSIATAMQDLR